METCATLEVFPQNNVSPLDTHIADIRITSIEPWQTLSPSHILARTHRV